MLPHLEWFEEVWKVFVKRTTDAKCRWKTHCDWLQVPSSMPHTPEAAQVFMHDFDWSLLTDTP